MFWIFFHDRLEGLCFFRREEDDEFIAAYAAAEGVVSGAGAEDVGHPFNECVAGEVALEVVHFFEAIQVHEEEGVGPFGVQFIGGLEDAGVVQKTGKGVVVGQAEGCFFLLGFFCLNQELEAVGEGDGKDEDEEGPGGEGLHEADVEEAVAGGKIILQGDQGGGAGGEEDAPADDDVPFHFQLQRMELVPAGEEAGREDGYMEQGEQVIQGHTARGLQEDGCCKEDGKPQGQGVVNLFAAAVFFRKEKVVEEGGRKEIEGAVFQEGGYIGADVPESQHVMVSQAPKDEG